MDGRYLGSGFTERRATSGETADWAYNNPASSSYGGTHIETELPLRQSYTSSHTLTNYTTSQHPTGASGDFETSLQTAEGSTAESSVMNFISSVESRGLQAGPAATSLLPQFRTSPWQTGTSPSTELFLTGALPSSGTFPTLSALSSYQHPSTFPARSFATTSALTVQHTTFSPSNGLLSPNDPLLQIKSSQSTVPTAFAFDRLCGASLGSSLPIQSSTYRSAQESAPHLLQPQFSLLPSPLSNSQQTTPPYGAPIFSTSIERALQRECSVIKHLQRPSSTQSVQQQLPASAQNSMQDYLPEEDDDVSYQDPSRHTPLSNSPNGIPSQAINSTVQQKTTTMQLPQTQSASLPSSGFSSTCGVKAKDDSNKTAEHLGEGSELHDQTVSSPMQQHRYASTAQKQSSVIASQSQPYTSAQLSSLMSGSPSQTYITSQSLISNLNEPQVFSPNQPVKLPSIYKTLPSLATESENETSVSQSLMYASGQKHIMSSASNREEYNEQAQRLCIGNASQSYSSSYSQSLSTVSYFSQGQESVSPSQSYASGQSLTPSPPFSSSYTHNLPSSNSTQDYTQIPPSPNKTDGMLLQQTQKYLLSDQSTSSTATYTEAIQNQSSVEQSPAYGKRKEDKSLFLTTKENCGELPVQEMQALQQASISSSTQSVTNSVIGVQSNVVYVVSKMEDRQAPSVIRSNSRSDDQLIGLAPMSSTKDDRMSILTGELLSHAHSHVISGTKNISTLMQSSHVALSTDLMKEHPVLLKVPTAQQENQQTQSNRDQRQLSQERAQFVQLPSAQVLLEPSQMILLQKPLLHTGSNQSKPIQMQPVSVQFLQMNNEILNSTVSTIEIPQITHQAVQSLKQHLVQKDSFSNSTNQHDAKQHFTLSSICFPDSMLMADERNILSNVDDILAATAAACGVTPQDYKSSSSEGDLASMSSPPDSKCHYELVNNKHGANSFSLQHMIPKTQTLSVNGGQLTTDIHKEIDGHQAFTSISHTQQNNSKLETSEEVTNHHKKPKGLISNEFSLNTNGGTLNPIANNHTDFHPTSQEYHPTEFEKAETISKNNIEKSVKIEERFAECLSDVFYKKRVRSKGSSQQATEDENNQPKPQKRSGQVKRQNSKGSETSSFSASEGSLDSYQQQERIWQKIKEVEEKQPEVKTGFIGSFLDFLKSGPKQQFSSPPIRSPNRTRKSCVPKRPLNQLSLPPKPIPPSTPMVSADMNSVSSTKRLDEELQKNLETLPSFSSDEDELIGKNQDLQKSISSALSSLDEPSDKQSVSKGSGESTTSDTNQVGAQSADTKPKEQQNPGLNQVPVEELVKNIPPGKLAVCLTTVAIEGLTDEDLSDSGEEGMYRERDEFVVKNEDIESLQVTLTAGIEPPAIWKVQKALLQKFIPELREGKRVFSATNSYLGYFGDAKTLYRRVYVKFLDTVNKREYVRVCNRKPRCKPMHSIRGSQKSLLAQRATAQAMSDSSASKSSTKQSLSKPRSKQTKAKAEPPPKKRKKWKEEFTESTLLTSPEAVGKGDEFTPPVPFASRFLNTRTMKETFKSFVELLISFALDADVMITLERENDELLLPHMKRVDGMITDNRRRLLSKLRVGQVFKNALDSFPELSVVTELKTDGETPAFKVRLSGKAYNRKTMKPTKSHNKPPLEYTVEQQKTQWFSLYHSLQHYKYHTYLICMNEIALLRSHGVDMGQEETVQTCMRNRAWVEGLFDRFGELLTQVQQACL